MVPYAPCIETGFTAWSSERGPEQVLCLLETLHQRFDEVGKRLEISKVDTTPESYMAVTTQPDHAVRMVKFAKQIMQSMVKIVNGLEGTLGPDTGSLRLRCGIHSGSATAGVMGGRFQIFGSTVGIASKMETTSHRHRIQVSESTAELLRKAEKGGWIQKRDDHVATTKDGREIQTYFVLITSPLSGRGGTSTYSDKKSTISPLSQRSGRSGAALKAGLSSMLRADNAPKCPRRQVWNEGDNNFMMSLPPMSRSARNKRLVAWINKLLSAQLIKVMAQRGFHSTPASFEITGEVLARVAHGTIPSEEVVDVIRPAVASHACDRSTSSTGEVSSVDLPMNVAQQLRTLVTKVAALYNEDNPYHNFEHAAHTTMSVHKLLNRCIAQDDDTDDYLESESSQSSKGFATTSSTRQYITGMASDPLRQFTVLFAALVHDCGHKGISSGQLTRLNPTLSQKYHHESVAEQHSIEMSWALLVDTEFTDLQKLLFVNESELQRFRQVLVNCLLSTDLSNGKSQARRDKRWESAFHTEFENNSLQEEEKMDLKATAIVECLVQASDVSHAMQHWKVYQKVRPCSRSLRLICYRIIGA